MTNDLQVLEKLVMDLREPFAAALTDTSLKFEAEAGFALQVLSSNDYAMKIALSNKQSVVNAVTNIAAIGISLNPAKKQAYLVPRDCKICLDISYMGLLDIAQQSGAIRWGQARLVHEKDKFEMQGIDQQPLHRFDPFTKERGNVIGVYVVVKTAEGDYLTEPMSVDEVNDIRDRSSAWRAWMEKKKKCPWVTDPGEMTKKTVVKRAYKYWPKTDRMDRAIDMLDRQNGEGLAALNDEQAIDVPTREVEEPAAVAYPVDQFDKNLPAWRKVIASGKKNADDIIAMVETKGVLTDEQKQAIRNSENPNT